MDRKRRLFHQGMATTILVVTALAGWSPTATSAQTVGGPKRSDAVVKTTTEAVSRSGDGQQNVTLLLTMNNDHAWHVYAHELPQDFPGIPTSVAVEGVKPEQVSIDYPSGRLVKDQTLGDYHVYENQVSIKVHVRRAAGDRGPLSLKVSFQACWQGDNGGKCLLPAAVTISVP
jgi:DsbC/DsbD-like thiol-disulfide interchange protein